MLTPCFSCLSCPKFIDVPTTSDRRTPTVASAPSRHVCGQRPDLPDGLMQDRGSCLLTGERVIIRHLVDDPLRERDPLPEAFQGGSAREIPPVQDVHVPVDLVDRNRIRGGVFQRLVQRVLGRSPGHRYITC